MDDNFTDMTLTEIAAGMQYRIEKSRVWWPWTEKQVPHAFKKKIGEVYSAWEAFLPTIEKITSSSDMADFYEFALMYTAGNIIRRYRATQTDVISRFFHHQIQPELVEYSSPWFGTVILKDTIMVREPGKDYCVIFNIHGDFDTLDLKEEDIHPASELKEIIIKGLPDHYRWERTSHEYFLKKYNPSAHGKLIYKDGGVLPIKGVRVPDYRKALASQTLGHLKTNMKEWVITHTQAMIPDIIEFVKWFISLGMTLFPPTSPLGAIGLAVADSTVSAVGGYLKGQFSTVPEQQKSAFYDTLIEIALNRMMDAGMIKIQSALNKLKIQYRAPLQHFFEGRVTLNTARQTGSRPLPARHTVVTDAKTKLAFGRQLYALDPQAVAVPGDGPWDNIVRYQKITGLIGQKAQEQFSLRRVRQFDYVNYLGDRPTLIGSPEKLKSLPAGTRLGIISGDNGQMVDALLKTEGMLAVGVNNPVIGARDRWQELDLATEIEWVPDALLKIKSVPDREFLLYAQHGKLSGQGIPENVLADTRRMKADAGALAPVDAPAKAPVNAKALEDTVIDLKAKPEIPVDYSNGLVVREAAELPFSESHERIQIIKYGDLLVLSTPDNKPDTLVHVSHGGFNDNSGVIKIPADYQIKFATPHDTLLRDPDQWFYTANDFRYFSEMDSASGYRISLYKDTNNQIPVPMNELKKEIFPAKWDTEHLANTQTAKERLLATGTMKENHIRNYNYESAMGENPSFEKMENTLDMNRWAQSNPVDEEGVPYFPNGPHERFDMVSLMPNAQTNTAETLRLAEALGYKKVRFVHCRIYKTDPQRPDSNKVYYVADPNAEHDYSQYDMYRHVLDGDVVIDLTQKKATFEVTEPVLWLFRQTSRNVIPPALPLPAPSISMAGVRNITSELFQKHAYRSLRVINAQNAQLNTTQKYTLPLAKDKDGNNRVIDSVPVKGMAMGGRFYADKTYQEVNQWMSDFMHQHQNRTLIFTYKDFQTLHGAREANMTGEISLEQSYVQGETPAEKLSHSDYTPAPSLMRDEKTVIDLIDKELRDNTALMLIVADASRAADGLPPKNAPHFEEEYQAASTFLTSLGFMTFRREVQYWPYDDEAQKNSFFVTLFTDRNKVYVFDPRIYWAVQEHPRASDIISSDRDWTGKVFTSLNGKHLTGHFRNIDEGRNGTWSSS